MILHFSQIFFTEGLTFTVYFHLSSCLFRVRDRIRNMWYVRRTVRKRTLDRRRRPDCLPQPVRVCRDRVRREMRNRLHRRENRRHRQATLCRFSRLLAGSGDRAQHSAAKHSGNGESSLYHRAGRAAFTQAAASASPCRNQPFVLQVILPLVGS